MRKITLLLIAVVAVITFSCKEDSLEKKRNRELKQFNEFIRAHFAGEDPKPSGLYYFEQEEGIGDSVRIGDQVEIYYKLMTLDSVVISQTRGFSDGYKFDPLKLIVLPPTNLSSSANYVDQLLALHEALTYMKKGTKSLLIFDSSLGFGQNSASGVPTFTPLIMEVEVYKVFPAVPPDQEEEQNE